MVKSKGPGWKYGKRMTGFDGKHFYPDVITPRGHLLELKPFTPSGIKEGRIKAEIYRKQLGRHVRVICYILYSIIHNK